MEKKTEELWRVEDLQMVVGEMDELLRKGRFATGFLLYFGKNHDGCHDC